MKHSKCKIKYFKRLFIITGFTLIIFIMHHSVLLAQSKTPESDTNMYPTFLLIIITLIVSSIFIGLLILGDPKYESKEIIKINTADTVVYDSVTDLGNVINGNLKSEFILAYYLAVVLLILKGAMFFLML